MNQNNKNNQQQKPPFIITAPKLIISSAFEHISDFEEQSKFIIDENGKQILKPFEFEKSNIKAGHTSELFHPIIYEQDPFERQECIERFEKLQNQVKVPQPFKCPKTHSVKQKLELRENSQKFGKTVLITSLKRLSNSSQNKKQQEKISSMINKAEKLFQNTQPLQQKKQKIDIGFDKSLFNQINKWKQKLQIEERQKLQIEEKQKVKLAEQKSKSQEKQLLSNQVHVQVKTEIQQNVEVQQKDQVKENKINSKQGSIKQNSEKDLIKNEKSKDQNNSVKQLSIKSGKQEETKKNTTPKSGQSKLQKSEKQSQQKDKEQNDSQHKEAHSQQKKQKSESKKSEGKSKKQEQKETNINETQIQAQTQTQTKTQKQEKTLIMKPKDLTRAKSANSQKKQEDKSETKRSNSQGKQQEAKIEITNLKQAKIPVYDANKKKQINQNIKQKLENEPQKQEEQQQVIKESVDQSVQDNEQQTQEIVNFGLVNINNPSVAISEINEQKEFIPQEKVEQSKLQETELQQQIQLQESILSNQDLIVSQLGESKLIKQVEDDKDSMGLSESQVTVQSTTKFSRFKSKQK